MSPAKPQREVSSGAQTHQQKPQDEQTVCEAPGTVRGRVFEGLPRVSPVEGDEKRYANLESPKGDSLFAAYEPQEMKLGKS